MFVITMRVLLFAVFLFSLYSTGFSLFCVQCTNNSIASCSGKLKNCTGGELCMSTITQTTAAEGQKTSTFDRDCGDANHCNSSGSMTSLISTEINSTCCSTDSCTPPQPTLTTGEKLTNNIQCPACLVQNAGNCPSSTLRNCTGDEKYCAVYEIQSDTDRTIIQGCASDSFCHTSQSRKLVNGKITDVMAICVRSGSNSLKARDVHLFTVLLGILVHII